MKKVNIESPSACSGPGRGAGAARVFDAVVRGRTLVPDELARRRASVIAAQKDGPHAAPLRRALRLANLVVHQAVERAG